MGLKLPFSLLSVYLFILLPVNQIFLINIPWVFNHCYDIFLASTLFYLLLLKKVPLRVLGLSYKNGKQNLLMGSLGGGLILLSLPAMDFLVKLSGLDQTELLANTINRPKAMNDLWLLVVLIMVHALMEQIFVSGLIVQALLKKYNPIVVIYMAGIIFSLLHFTFNLSTFIIGLLTACGYILTGTIVTPLIFQIFCGITKIMLENFYPHLITLVGFLF